MGDPPQSCPWAPARLPGSREVGPTEANGVETAPRHAPGVSTPGAPPPAGSANRGAGRRWGGAAGPKAGGLKRLSQGRLGQNHGSVDLRGVYCARGVRPPSCGRRRSVRGHGASRAGGREGPTQGLGPEDGSESAGRPAPGRLRRRSSPAAHRRPRGRHGRRRVRGARGGAETAGRWACAGAAGLGAVAAAGPAGPGAQRCVNNLRTRASARGGAGRHSRGAAPPAALASRGPASVRAPGGRAGPVPTVPAGLCARPSSEPRDRVAGLREGLRLWAAEAKCPGCPAARVFPGRPVRKVSNSRSRGSKAYRTLRCSGQADRCRAET